MRGREGGEAVLEVTDNGPGMTSRRWAGCSSRSSALPRHAGCPATGWGWPPPSGWSRRTAARSRIRSAPGSGTTATVRFPCVDRPRAEARARGAGCGPASWRRRDEPPRNPGRRRRPARAGSAAAAPGPLGQLSEAASAPAAEELLKGTVRSTWCSPTWRCPTRTTGSGCCRRRRRTHPDTPVVVLTAFGNIEGALDTIQKGAFDYLAKPFDVDAIVRVVASGARAAAAGGGEQEPPRSR